MQWACRKSATTRLMHRSKLKCSAAAWGPFKEFGLVANRAPSPNYSQASHITVPGAQLSIRLLRGSSADAGLSIGPNLTWNEITFERTDECLGCDRRRIRS
jgi:hypothetical protein